MGRPEIEECLVLIPVEIYLRPETRKAIQNFAQRGEQGGRRGVVPVRDLRADRSPQRGLERAERLGILAQHQVRIGKVEMPDLPEESRAEIPPAFSQHSLGTNRGTVT